MGHYGRHGVLLAGILLGVAALAAPVFAEERDTTRIDLYDTRSNRTGSAIVDQKTGRVDFYDTRGRREGYGTIDKSGRIDLYDLKGNRTGSGLPSPGGSVGGGRR